MKREAVATSSTSVPASGRPTDDAYEPPSKKSASRSLNLRPLDIEKLPDTTKEGTDELVAMTNEFNELLYDKITPRVFGQLYDLDESQQLRSAKSS